MKTNRDGGKFSDGLNKRKKKEYKLFIEGY